MLERTEIDNGNIVDKMKDWYLCSPKNSPTIPVGRTICVGGGRVDEGGVLIGSGLGYKPDKEDC